MRQLKTFAFLITNCRTQVSGKKANIKILDINIAKGSSINRLFLQDF